MHEHPPTELKPPTMSPRDASTTLTKAHLLNICAGGLFICFFLPWLRILFGRFSGFEIAKDGGKYLVLWAIPLFCVVTILAGLTKQTSQKSIAVFTGVLPFAFLAIGLYNGGKNLMQGLDIGAYISLALGLILILLPSNLKHTP